MQWDIHKSRQLYNIANWSEGYLEIDDKGDLLILPDKNIKNSINLPDLTQKILDANIQLPVLVRFMDILLDRIKTMNNSFRRSMIKYKYSSTYTSIYPVKVNQQSTIVNELANYKKYEVGMEVGSKTELFAVMATPNANGVIICNGFKDAGYIRQALISQLLGNRVYLVVDKYNEIKAIVEQAEKLNIRPSLGLRVRISENGDGTWQNSGGDVAKFGMNSTLLLKALDYLSSKKMLDCCQMLHAHMGSQITKIQDIKNGIKESMRYYCELKNLGVDLSILNIGGGLGVDYEGTGTGRKFSMDYDIENYTDVIVETIKKECEEDSIKYPEIFTESGRAITAHHAVLVCNVIGTEKILPNAIKDSKVAINKFIDKQISLERLAEMENTVLRNSKSIVNYYCNFSIFQSMPDAWGLKQVFPIVPLQKLCEEPDIEARLLDITCDSDGKVEDYSTNNKNTKSIQLHDVTENEEYYLGIFLLGAYQEILGDMHNLFGDTNVVNVKNIDGQHQIVHIEAGDTSRELLEYLNYNTSEILKKLNTRLASICTDRNIQKSLLDELKQALNSYTYLK